MVSTRLAIAKALEAAVDNVTVRRDVGNLGEIDPAYRGALQLVRTRIEPGKSLGQYWMDYDLSVVTIDQDPETGEDALDDLVDDTLTLLETLTWLTWSSAERGTHPAGYPAYLIKLRASGRETKE